LRVREGQTHIIRGLGNVGEGRRRNPRDKLLDLDVFSHDGDMDGGWRRGVVVVVV